MRTILSSILLMTATALFAFDEVRYTPAATTFCLQADASMPQAPVLRLYKAGTGGKAYKRVALVRDGAVWSATVSGDLRGVFYTFDAGRGECPGLTAQAVGVNGKRAAVVDLKATDPDGWQADTHPVVKAPTDHVIYEVHMRDYSISPTSQLPYAGKYLAWTDPRATDHLVRLGVNTVHFQPVFDFASVDEQHLDRPQFNWGYDPLNYNVPDGSYSTDPTRPEVRIREFKQMVQAMHRAGLRVVFDAVYNHTNDIAGSNFQRLYPDVFYRKRADGTYSDGSGCGNETASERPMVRQFIVESVKYWVREYHIDGFRFDLMGIHDIETMRAVRAALDEIDPTLLLYGEGWACSPCALPESQLAMKANMSQLPGIAAFDDDMRDALRGPFNDDTIGAFLAGRPGSEGRLAFGITGCCVQSPAFGARTGAMPPKPWAAQPAQAISYVSCHDDMCLVDRLRATVPGIKDDELVRLHMLAHTAVLTAQGIPFMLGGEEMLRNKRGVHNSYNAPDSVNALDWSGLTRHPEVFEYLSRLIALRRAHPAFRLTTADEVRQHLEFLDIRPLLVAYRLKNYAGRDEWRDIVVVLNADREPADITLPTRAQWTVVCAGGQVNADGLAPEGIIKGATATVPPQSALILHTE